MKLLRYVFYFLLGLAMLSGAFLLYATLVDWKPEGRITIERSSGPDTVSAEGSLSVLTWNIGYCGLG